MQDFQGKVAVITGAGRGIGRGIAERCAKEGMKVVLAGIGLDSLNKTAAELKAKGAMVLVVQTDVSKLADVKNLAQQTLDAFGAVHLLVNNAGVGGGTTIWESTLADWEWTLGVNLWGVVYGIKVFVPMMLAQDCECHVVNVSSIAGLLDGPGLGIYKVTKQGIITISETLYYELMQRQSKVGVSVLIPGFVKTDIMTFERNRPPELQNKPDEVVISPEIAAIFEFLAQSVEAGIAVEQVADEVFAALREKQFYVLTHPDVKDAIQAHANNIALERNPTIIEAVISPSSSQK